MKVFVLGTGGWGIALAMLLHQFDSDAFNTIIKVKFPGQALLFRKCLGIFLQDDTSRVGFSINCMTDTIDQTLAVKGFTVQNFGQVLSNFIIIIPIGNM